MLIVCPNCTTSYQVESTSLGREGRSVRCARCRGVWFASATAPVPAVAGSDEWDVIDTGPRVPAVDAPPRAAKREPPPPLGMATRDGNNRPPATKPASPGIDPPTSGNIDVAGLGAAIENVRAEQVAAADAVLAEVTGQQMTAAESPPVVPEQLAVLPFSQTSQSAPPSQAPEEDGGTEPEDIETFAARRARRNAMRPRNWLKPGLPLALMLLFAVNASLLLWRSQVVQLLPQTASLYDAIGLPVNLRGLSFESMRMTRAEQDGVGVLVVEGSIVNVTRRPLEVPRLRLAVRNTYGNELYSWTSQPSRSLLGPGEAMPFRSRLASPPAEARDVTVRFFSRRDLVAGLN